MSYVMILVAQQMLNYSGHMFMYTLDDSDISCQILAAAAAAQ